jgi:hypothetical protein
MTRRPLLPLLPLLLLLALSDAQLDPSPAVCVAQGEALCNADGACEAFGIFGTSIQLHGCATTVPNADWTIFVRDEKTSAFSQLPGTINVNETACAQHARTGMTHTCTPSPPPPPSPPLYKRVGSIDVGTFENTLFYWEGRILNVENIPCGYWDHAGVWEPAVFGNHSYARIRDFQTGEVLVNVTATIGFGFVTAFPDYDRGILYLFGVASDRCRGNGQAQDVWTWWTSDPALADASFRTATAFQLNQTTYNVGVSLVGPLPRGPAGSAGSSDSNVHAAWLGMHARVRHDKGARPLPPHNFVMMLECFHFAINAGTNLTSGWVLLPNTTVPAGAPCGGPTMRYNPNDGYYYILTGGTYVHMYRTLDFVAWEESNPSPFITPAEGDAEVAPFQDFPAAATIKGSPPNLHVGVPQPYPRRPFTPYWQGSNWTSWVENSNDADICCLHANVSDAAYIIWGASTQGRPPKPPLTGTDAGTNAVAIAQGLPLWEMLSAYFS